MNVEEEDDEKGQRDAYWRAREAADDEREGGTAPSVADAEPAEQPEQNPFATAFTKAALGRAPSEYEQPPTPEPEFEPEPYAPSSAAGAVQPTASPDRAAKYDAALADVRRIASEKTPGVDIGAVEAGQRERHKKTAANDFTRAIQAWMFRKPFEPSAPTDDSDALTVQSLKAKQAGADKAQRLSAAEMVAKALRGEKQPGAGQRFDDPYHQALASQAGSLVDERKRKAQAEADKKTREGGELEALRREAGKQLPGTDVTGLGAEDLRALIRAKDAKERARILSAAKAAKEAEGRPLAPTALEGIADADVAVGQVKGLEKKFNELGMGSPTAKASAYVTDLLGLQFTDAAQFDAESRRVQQAAGKILEGGKLAAGDETKYRRMLLKPGDSPEVVAIKTAGMVDFLEDIKADRIKVYRAGGYKVPPSLDTPPAAGLPPQKVTPSGKPYAKKQVSPSTKRVRYLDAAGAVIEEADG